MYHNIDKEEEIDNKPNNIFNSGLVTRSKKTGYIERKVQNNKKIPAPNIKHTQTHHIIPQQLWNEKHLLWEKSGININNRINLISLPTKSGKRFFDALGIDCNRTIHVGRGLHDRVVEEMKQKMNAILEAGEKLNYSKNDYRLKFLELIQNERYLLKTGQRRLVRWDEPPIKKAIFLVGTALALGSMQPKTVSAVPTLKPAFVQKQAIITSETKRGYTLRRSNSDPNLHEFKRQIQTQPVKQSYQLTSRPVELKRASAINYPSSASMGATFITTTKSQHLEELKRIKEKSLSYVLTARLALTDNNSQKPISLEPHPLVDLTIHKVVYNASRGLYSNPFKSTVTTKDVPSKPTLTKPKIIAQLTSNQKQGITGAFNSISTLGPKKETTPSTVVKSSDKSNQLLFQYKSPSSIPKAISNKPAEPQTMSQQVRHSNVPKSSSGSHTQAKNVLTNQRQGASSQTKIDSASKQAPNTAKAEKTQSPNKVSNNSTTTTSKSSLNQATKQVTINKSNPQSREQASLQARSQQQTQLQQSRTQAQRQQQTQMQQARDQARREQQQQSQQAREQARRQQQLQAQQAREQARQQQRQQAQQAREQARRQQQLEAQRAREQARQRAREEMQRQQQLQAQRAREVQRQREIQAQQAREQARRQQAINQQRQQAIRQQQILEAQRQAAARQQKK